MEQAVIVGAGPCGLAAALELRKIGIDALILEKHCLAHSIYLYPVRMQFFSTADRLGIGDIPFSSPHTNPYRDEALSYYRSVAAHAGLRIRSYEEVTAIRPIPSDGDAAFEVVSKDRAGTVRITSARRVIVATGYFDHPNLLGIPGEELPNVTHYYREAHPYTGTKVAIIGGNNSAVDAAMDLIKVGASVTIVYRGDEASQSVKPWVKPLFQAAVANGRIAMRYRSRVIAIQPRSITVESAAEDGAVRREEWDNDFVLALTGYRPNRKLLEDAGVQVEELTDKPLINPDTMETNVPGLYVAGVIASGRNANEIFIESGRFHGVHIAKHIAAQRAVAASRS
ncbi:YpdA family putative bacillithiol disulfide reductase [Paenibacillus chartarius]|uniref:YpdA family putative bacillithiol disulfide reductase n=1 Tax=Paenibacillus chartarius TaxID=747481 RepID=A0ABV6DQL3_9BACL